MSSGARQGKPERIKPELHSRKGEGVRGFRPRCFSSVARGSGAASSAKGDPGIHDPAGSLLRLPSLPPTLLVQHGESALRGKTRGEKHMKNSRIIFLIIRINPHTFTCLLEANMQQLPAVRERWGCGVSMVDVEWKSLFRVVLEYRGRQGRCAVSCRDWWLHTLGVLLCVSSSWCGVCALWDLL